MKKQRKRKIDTRMVREGKFRGNADYWRLCQTERYKENKKKTYIYIHRERKREDGREEKD